jgi:hypothetical protein
MHAHTHRTESCAIVFLSLFAEEACVSFFSVSIVSCSRKSERKKGIKSARVVIQDIKVVVTCKVRRNRVNK